MSGTNKNGYLERKAVRESIITNWTRQADQDAFLLFLEDEGVPFEEAVAKVQKFNDYADEISIGLSSMPSASHKRRLTDDRLENYCGEWFAPWSERYDYWKDSGI